MKPVVPIDLTKNSDVAALVADMEPGDKVYACFTIKDKDDQTLNLRLSEMAPTADELSKPDEESDDEDAMEDGEEPDEKATDEKPAPQEKTPGEKMVERMASAGSDY